MTWSSRRALAVLSAATLVGLVAYLPQAIAQPGLPVAQPVPPFDGRQPGKQPPKPPPPTGDPTDLGGLSLTPDEALKTSLAKKIQAAQDNIKVENWKEAVEILQQMLDREEDVFVPVTREIGEGQTTTVNSSVRSEAALMIGNLPARGLEYYQVTYGGPAGEKLKLAKETGDASYLAEVMRRFLYTDAGVEATEMLATHLLDRGKVSPAALCFERLFQRVNNPGKKLSEQTLFKAAIAFQICGDQRNLDIAWKHLEGKGNGLAIGAKNLDLAEAKKFVGGQTSVAMRTTRHDQLFVGGNSSRSAQGDGGPAFLEYTWKHDIFTNARDERAKNTVQSYLDQAVKHFDGLKQPILHGFSPLAVTLKREDGTVPLMVYRSHWGIHAREVKNGEVYWEAPSTWSLAKMALEPRHVGALQNWLNMYLTQRARVQAVYENSLTGSLSSDNVRVYAVEDFQVVPNTRNQFNRPGYNPYPGPLGEAMQHNRLQAYDLDSGKLLWEVGGKEEKEKDKEKAKGDLGGSFFLGSPLPINGKLYVLNEKNQEMRLVCLDPATGNVVGKPQRLADTREKLTNEPDRRGFACHLSYGEGILVCPTNCGGLLGVDLLTNSLVWAYGYRDKDFQPIPQSDPRFGVPQPGMIFTPDGRQVPIQTTASYWRNSMPIIQEGKVVFTAPDAGAVHCINLRDGGRVWKVSRSDTDLYVAGVFSGKVVIVGKGYCRALNLADGTEAWRLETGLPSGVGIASKDVYYLPLAKANKTLEPEICVIDINKGFIVAHTRSRKKEVPGNLLFYEGSVLSQTLTSVASYPQLEVELKRIDELLAKDKEDPEGLIRRGDLRLDGGNLGGAIEDLRTALASKKALPREMSDKARGKLYESLTEYFQRDFGSAEKYLKEYEAMCRIDMAGLAGEQKKQAEAEQRRRLGNYYCLLGKGREAQKKLVEAFEAYMNFGSLGQDSQEMMSVIDDPGVKAAPSVWAQGRIAAMVASSTKEERAPLEALIAKRWDAVKDGNIDALRGFVATFGSMLSVGRQARLALAERLAAENDPKALLDAERHLLILRTQSDDPSIAAQSVEAMARLMTRKGLMEDAAFYYRVLGRDFSKVVVKDGKTGQDFYNELATDKRFLPYLDEAMSLVGTKLKYQQPVREDKGSFPFSGQMYQLEQRGERLPFFEKYKVSMRSDYHQFKMHDRTADNEPEHLSLNLTATHFQTLLQLVYRYPPQYPRFPYYNMGHLVVLQMGHMVYAIDPIGKQLLWEKNLSGQTSIPALQQYSTDPRDGSVQIIYSDGWMQQLGLTSSMSPAALCLMTSESLIGVDPITGQVMWTRTEMPRRAHLLNDDQYAFVVEVGQDNTPGATKVFRLADGATVPAKDFAALYRNRLQMVGRSLVSCDTDAKGATLRIYDVVAGQDRYKETFPAGTKSMESEDDSITGVVEPTGKLTVVDVKTAKVLLKGQMKPEHVAKAEKFHLLKDGKYVYVATNNPAGQDIIPNTKMSNLLPQSGLRALMINGDLYSFDAKSGELNWYNPAHNQMIVLEQFNESPVVLLTTRYTKWLNGQQVQQAQVIAIQSYDKRTGKRLLEKEEVNNGMQQQFHSVKVDTRTGRVDLTSYNLRISHILETDAGAGGGKDGKDGGKGTGGAGSPGTTGRPGVEGSRPLPGPGRIEIAPAPPPVIIDRIRRER